MDLKELIQKESVRTKEEIIVPEKKVFKKERVWLEPKPDTTKQNKTEQNTTKYNQTDLNRTEHTSEQIQTEPNTILNTKPDTTKQNKTEQNTNLFSLTGNRKKVVLYLYDICLANQTDVIETTYRNVSENTQIAYGSIKTTMRLLKEEGYYKISAPKGGRSSKIEIEIPKDLLINYSQNQTKLNRKLNIQLNINPADSSNKSLNEDNTSTIQIPENLRMLISQKEIQKLLEKGLAEENIEFSLKHFSYDLEHNLVKSKTSPINLFYGVIRSGNTYKSLKLMEIENEELKLYQSKIQKLELENQQLKENELQKKYQAFLTESPNYLEKLKDEQKLNVSMEVIQKIGFSEWLKNEL